MIDIRNTQLLAVADMLEQEPSVDDSTWYEVEDVEIDLPMNLLHDLTVAIDPLQVSNYYGIDLFVQCLNFLQSHV